MTLILKLENKIKMTLIIKQMEYKIIQIHVYIYMHITDWIYVPNNNSIFDLVCFYGYCKLVFALIRRFDSQSYGYLDFSVRTENK